MSDVHASADACGLLAPIVLERQLVPDGLRAGKTNCFASFQQLGRDKPRRFTVCRTAMLSSNTHQGVLMLLAILALAFGGALALVLPTGVEPGTKQRKPTEEGFQQMLRRRGLQ